MQSTAVAVVAGGADVVAEIVDDSAAADSWTSNNFLYKVWRRREAQLMKLLTVRNLAQTRKAFDDEGVGLTLARFMKIMLKLLGMWSINKDELVIQLLDLFCCIDLNGDGVRGRARPQRPR
jgi:hypothetical protein